MESILRYVNLRAIALFLLYPLASPSRYVGIKREGLPEEVAYVVLFLASEYASYITGETIEINGGMLMD